MDAILAVDQGTTSTKALLVSLEGNVLARAGVPVGITLPQPGWVEQDAAEIWDSVLGAVAAAQAQAPGVRPVALALSTQHESVVVWRRVDGEVVAPVLGWQDRRTEPDCEQLRADGVEPLIRERTGLGLDPMFSAPKMRWALDHIPGGAAAARRGDLCVGPMDAWLTHRLSGAGTVLAEAGNASRTLLLDLRRVAWDDELLELFGVPAAALGEVRRSDGPFGTTRAVGSIPAGLPIAAVLADSHAALFAHGCSVPGAAKATYGTGTSVMAPTDGVGEPVDGIARTLAWLRDEPVWALEGNILATGAALDWMAEMLGVDGGQGLEILAAGATSTHGAHLVPAFSGLGAPYWDREAVGLLEGITRATTRADLALAAYESVALQVCDVLDRIDAGGGATVGVVHADGGASASPTIMQRQADLSGRTVLASDVADMSALGAAQLAGVALDLWPAGAIPQGTRGHARYIPQTTETERAQRRGAWAAAVARSRVPAALPPVMATTTVEV